MIEDISVARNEMSQMLNDSWNLADWTGINAGTKPQILWQGREKAGDNPPSGCYARFKVVHNLGTQGSLSGDQGTKLWDRYGLIFVQCFGALPSGRALEDAEYMAQVAQRAYQGKESPGCIWFRSATVAEIGPTDGWYQINMTAQFEYIEGR